MTEALKPCPFCGDKRVAIHSDHDPDDFGRFYMVRCHGCGAQSQGVFASHGNDCPLHYEEVRDAWNRRPEPAPASVEARDSEDASDHQAMHALDVFYGHAAGSWHYTDELIDRMRAVLRSAPASQARPAGGSEGVA